MFLAKVAFYRRFTAIQISESNVSAIVLALLSLTPHKFAWPPCYSYFLRYGASIHATFLENLSPSSGAFRRDRHITLTYLCVL